MKSTLSIFALLALVLQPAIAFDFKGIKPGMVIASEDEWQAIAKDALIATDLHVFRGSCHPVNSRDNRLARCGGLTTIAEWEAGLSVHLDEQGRIERISVNFPSAAFLDVRGSVINKYGQPTKTNRSTLQNTFGAKYENVQDCWFDKSSTSMCVERFDEEIANGRFDILTKQYVDKHAKKPSSDL